MLGSRVLRGVAGLAVPLVLVAAGCGSDNGGTAATPETTVPSTSTDAEPAGDVLDVAAGEGDLNTFLGALESAAIMDGLHGTGPFTVFIPTDDAFEAYLGEAGMSQTELFADPVMLRRLLEHHIVEADDPSEMVMAMDGQSFTTAAGTPLAVAVADDDTVMVGDATVLRYDITASNGVIHVIDDVLIPPAA